MIDRIIHTRDLGQGPAIQPAVEKLGSHWFKPDTMRFFNSRVGSVAYLCTDGRYRFISSEKGPDGIRRYSVRAWEPGTSAIKTDGDFQRYGRRDSAERAIHRQAAHR